MDIKDLHSSWDLEAPYRISKPLKFEILILAIEYLDENKIIDLKSFTELSDQEIRDKYFCMVHPNAIKKAIIKITDKRSGKVELSQLTTITEIHSSKGIETIEKTVYF